MLTKLLTRVREAMRAKKVEEWIWKLLRLWWWQGKWLRPGFKQMTGEIMEVAISLKYVGNGFSTDGVPHEDLNMN